MIQQLQPLGVDVPGGYGVSSIAYDNMMDQFHLRERIELLLKDLDGKISPIITIHVGFCVSQHCIGVLIGTLLPFL